MGRQEAVETGEAGVDDLEEAVGDVARHMAKRRGKHINAQSKRRDLKIRADGGRPLLIKDAGIVVRTVDHQREILFDELQRVAHRAVDRRAAAEGQRILQRTLGIGMLQIAALQKAAALGRAADLAGQAAHFVHTLAQRLQSAVESLEMQAVDRVAHADELFALLDQQHDERLALRIGGNDGKAVLGSEDRGLHPLGVQRLDRGDDPALILHLALADDGLADQRQRAHVALAHGAAAQRARMNAAVEELLIHMQNIHRDAGAAAQRRIEADAHHRAHLLYRAEGTHAQGVAVDQVAVVLLKKVLAELAVLVPADAVVEPVDRLALRRHVKKHLAGTLDRGDHIRIDLHGASVVDHLIKLPERQVFAVEHQYLCHSTPPNEYLND